MNIHTEGFNHRNAFSSLFFIKDIELAWHFGISSL